jgi:hypothetical protein
MRAEEIAHKRCETALESMRTNDEELSHILAVGLP